jgi:hypothetical protein
MCNGLKRVAAALHRSARRETDHRPGGAWLPNHSQRETRHRVQARALKRLGRSPDDADALALTFAQEVAPDIKSGHSETRAGYLGRILELTMEQEEQFGRLESAWEDIDNARVLLEEACGRRNLNANLSAAELITGRSLQTLQEAQQSPHVVKAAKWVKLAIERLEQHGADACWPARDMLVAAGRSLNAELGSLV